MKWPFRRKVRGLQLAWSYKAEGQIWRFLPTVAGPLILEERQAENKTLRFVSLDPATGVPLWRSEEFLHRWWMTVETVSEDVLFLHEYATPDMPDHKCINALDVGSGKLLWTNADMKFLFSHEGAVYAAKDTYEGRTFHELDLHTGVLLRDVDDAYLGVLRTMKEEKEGTHLHFPEVPSGQAPWGQAEAPVERIEGPSYCVVGWYERENPADTGSPLRHRLAVKRMPGGEDVFEDVLDADMRVPVPDLFVRRENDLYYIKEKHTLCALDLSKLRPN